MNITIKDILLKLAEEFSLSRDNLAGRIRLQKLIYLLQASGLKLGYGFRWYNYGPYSQELTQDAFSVLTNQKSYNRNIVFGGTVRKKLDGFKTLFVPGLSDPKYLELVASVDYIRKHLRPEVTKDTIVREFKGIKKAYFDGTLIFDHEINEAFDISDKIRGLQGVQVAN